MQRLFVFLWTWIYNSKFIIRCYKWSLKFIDAIIESLSYPHYIYIEAVHFQKYIILLWGMVRRVGT